MENIRDKIGAKILERNGIKYSWQCSNFAKLPPPVHKAGEWDSGFCGFWNGWEDKVCRRCGEAINILAARELTTVKDPKEKNK